MLHADNIILVYMVWYHFIETLYVILATSVFLLVTVTTKKSYYRSSCPPRPVVRKRVSQHLIKGNAGCGNEIKQQIDKVWSPAISF